MVSFAVAMLNFTRRFPLQVQVAIGALVLYGVTLSHGVTINSLSLTAEVGGWDWMPMLGQPLLWLFTLPIRLLPVMWVPLGLNFFSAATAALTLGLLARTVQLLPWERPWDDTSRWAKMLPVLLACGVCGLEFSFWQEATAATGEMLDQLFLATSLWLLLEYRVRRETRWLDAAVLVWGLGMAENWLMLMALPLFIGGIIWMHGLRFFLHRRIEEQMSGGETWLRGLLVFRVKFLLRLAALGLAGFSFYALLPLFNGLAPHSPWSLGQAWHASLRQTKYTVLMFYFQFWMTNMALALGLAVYFLAPMLSCLVRFAREGTYHKRNEDRIVLWIYRILRTLLLLAWLWLAFDPVAGPRQIVQHQFGISLPMLTFDYFNGLAAGFLAGNLLLLALEVVQQLKHTQTRTRWQHLVVPFAAGGLALIIAALAARNTLPILRLNFHSLQRFGELAVESLPAGRGVMLSDQPQKLQVFQAALARHGNRKDWLAVDTHALPAVEYRSQLERHQPMGWLTDENRHELTPLEMEQLLEQIARTNRLFYLHPSYGYFFERFDLEPTGAIYKMILRGKDPLEVPPLPEALARANETFWNGAWQKGLARFVTVTNQQKSVWQKTTQLIGLTPAPPYQDHLQAEWYSLALDGWGVALQRQGRWLEARLRFEQALMLNPDNFSARISLACNTNHQSGLKLGLGDVDKVAGQLGNSQRLSQVMNSCGPFDEPLFCYLLGCAFQQIDHPLQAAEQFERARMLAPGAAAPVFALAELYSRLRRADLARPLINQLQEEARYHPANSTVNVELAFLEATSWFSQTNVNNARTVLQSVLQQHPDDAQILNRVVGAYLAFGDFTNALQLISAHLAKSPDDVPSLNLQAAILIQSGKAAAALPLLDHILALTNLPTARLNRGFARLASQDYAAAEADYREVQKSGVETSQVCYGLAAIADHRHDTNQVVYYLRLCLTNTPAGTPLWREASARLHALEPNPRAK
jgi:tetratricopeptide (TPR) repeat protein